MSDKPTYGALMRWYEGSQRALTTALSELTEMTDLARQLYSWMLDEVPCIGCDKWIPTDDHADCTCQAIEKWEVLVQKAHDRIPRREVGE